MTGLWQGRVFGMLQGLAYGLASGEVLEDILARINTTSTQISTATQGDKIIK